MLSRRFERLFRRLLSAFIAYDDAPRSAERVTELASLRVALDRVRSEIADEIVITSRRRPKAEPFITTALSPSDIAVVQVQSMIGN